MVGRSRQTDIFSAALQSYAAFIHLQSHEVRNSIHRFAELMIDPFCRLLWERLLTNARESLLMAMPRILA